MLNYQRVHHFVASFLYRAAVGSAVRNCASQVGTLHMAVSPCHVKAYCGNGNTHKNRKQKKHKNKNKKYHVKSCERSVAGFALRIFTKFFDFNCSLAVAPISCPLAVTPRASSFLG